ncbi:hypothetical protein FB451DRAFT_1170422 [Mycena latifolia]|nr:hypothetical protein FB451DRAFT_1170422 [Mycena latifolia]
MPDEDPASPAARCTGSPIVQIQAPQCRIRLSARARWGGEQGRKWMCAGNLHWTAQEAAPHATTAVGELPRTEASQAELVARYARGTSAPSAERATISLIDVGKRVIGWTYDVHTAGALFNRWGQRSGAGAENVLATEKVKTAIDNVPPHRGPAPGKARHAFVRPPVPLSRYPRNPNLVTATTPRMRHRVTLLRSCACLVPRGDESRWTRRHVGFLGLRLERAHDALCPAWTAWVRARGVEGVEAGAYAPRADAECDRARLQDDSGRGTGAEAVETRGWGPRLGTPGPCPAGLYLSARAQTVANSPPCVGARLPAVRRFADAADARAVFPGQTDTHSRNIHASQRVRVGFPSNYAPQANLGRGARAGVHADYYTAIYAQQIRTVVRRAHPGEKPVDGVYHRRRMRANPGNRAPALRAPARCVMRTWIPRDLVSLPADDRVEPFVFDPFRLKPRRSGLPRKSSHVAASPKAGECVIPLWLGIKPVVVYQGF